MRYHTSMGRVGKCVLLPREAGRQGDRQTGRIDITKIVYIES